MSETAPSQREALIARITAAFDGVEREDGVTLHEADVIDSYGTDDERTMARRLDTDGRWQDVPEEWIENGCWSLTFFDAKGFRYYIPAYMTWTLRHYDRSASATVDFTVYTFMHSAPETDERFSLLTPEQRRAICAFLWYMAGQEERCDTVAARNALTMGWDDYGPE